MIPTSCSKCGTVYHVSTQSAAEEPGRLCFDCCMDTRAADAGIQVFTMDARSPGGSVATVHNALASIFGEELIEITVEDRLRARIIESLSWIDQGAVGRARDTLLDALKIKNCL